MGRSNVTEIFYTLVHCAKHYQQLFRRLRSSRLTLEPFAEKPIDNQASSSFCTELEANRDLSGGGSHNSIRHGRETAEITHQSSMQYFNPCYIASLQWVSSMEKFSNIFRMCCRGMKILKFLSAGYLKIMAKYLFIFGLRSGHK